MNIMDELMWLNVRIQDQSFAAIVIWVYNFLKIRDASKKQAKIK
jgi:hypothetical protein